MSVNLRLLFSLRNYLVLGVLAGLIGCEDCGGIDDPFDRGTPADDDDVADDDDDDSSSPMPGPELVVTVIAPDFTAGEALASNINVGFEVTDQDSASYTVEVSFSTDGVAGVFNNATLVGEDSHIIGADPGPPIDAHENAIIWDAGTDLVGIVEQAVLQLCPFDDMGNAGECVLLEGDDDPIIGPTDLGAFCQEGHLETGEWLNGEAVIPLSDGYCLNYQTTNPPAEDDYSAQFLLVFVNPSPEDAVFTISSITPPDLPIGDDDDDASGDDDDDSSAAGDDDDSAAAGDDDDSAAPPPVPPQMRSSRIAPTGPGVKHERRPMDSDALLRRIAQRLDAGRTGDFPERRPMLNCSPDVGPEDVHNNNLNFEFRDSIMADAERQSHGANLYALGESVAIYVDDETPIDWDADCDDPNNPVEASDLPAFGFDNCDLEEVVDTIDNNIWPTLTSLYGMPSDVDNNCRVTIFLSHRVNRLTSTNDEEADDYLLVKSFAEPAIDLWSSDLTLNPGSNEEEIIFLYAPDPVGFWGTPVQMEDYLNYEVAGRVAVALQDLVSYATHREVQKTLLDPSNPEDVDNPPAEEDWLNDAMGLLAADLTGFGAISYPDAWIYMDRSHLLKLQAANDLEDFRDRGGQYLFARYLHDLYGDELISKVINAETQGVDSVMEVAEEFESFGELVLTWATAMAVSGRANSAGLQLVPDAVIPNFSSSGTVVVANPQAPQPGELYGANGYQLGFNVRGQNRVFNGGSDAAGPTEEEGQLVRTGNLDFSTFHPQTDYFGSISGQMGVSVVLVSGLEQAINYLKVETVGGSDLLTNVIRIPGTSPHAPALTLEDVDGAKITTVRHLGELDLGGLDRMVIGRIDPSEVVDVSTSLEPPSGDDDDSAAPPPPPPGDDDDSADDDDPAPGELTVTDTDRYGFTLAATAEVGIWIDRRISGTEGIADLADPFFAVVPAEDVPDAFDYSQWGFGPTPAAGNCWDPLYYNYPVTMPDWLGAQANLMSIPTEGTQEGDGPWESLVQGIGSYDCDYDHDQDGIPDSEEPQPTSFIEQVLLRQAEHLVLDPGHYASTFGLIETINSVEEPWYSAAYIDIDSNEEPDNDVATEVLSLNIGGRAVLEGEEAVWYGTLPAGDYILVVGDATDSTGEYDLTLRVLDN